ncbi:tRNA (adenosine(37)-N6)-threonylcarbamoyltransferase complex dimerization subunit type 1 TsaB [candidate division WOR-3 bacterium]|nr:tRNA (adenosine(37)-N6)-threonylcarbamoyltransferase complex dimerization subunit type 1 TsaB [candidate division WOR-3 bacterium]
MIFLGIDTSSLGISLYLETEKGENFEISTFPGKPAGEDIVAVFKDALETICAEPKEVNKIAVVTGPGSFTGLRVGMAFAKGLSKASGARLKGINALYAIAWKYRKHSELIFSVRDAKNGRYYCGLFKSDKNRLEPVFMTLALREEEISAYIQGERFLLAGEGRNKAEDLFCGRAHTIKTTDSYKTEIISPVLIELWEDPLTKELDLSSAVPEYFSAEFSLNKRLFFYRPAGN